MTYSQFLRYFRRSVFFTSPRTNFERKKLFKFTISASSALQQGNPTSYRIYICAIRYACGASIRYNRLLMLPCLFSRKEISMRCSRQLCLSELSKGITVRKQNVCTSYLPDAKISRPDVQREFCIVHVYRNKKNAAIKEKHDWETIKWISLREWTRRGKKRNG